jgi:outer membrane usher protein
VPNLLSYYGNRLGIGAGNVPMDYGIDTTEKLIAPPYRGAAVVTCPAQRTQSFTGAFVVESSDTSEIPAYGQLTVTAEAKPVISSIGKGGEFYLENLAAGRHAAEIQYKGGRCRFSLDIPDVEALFVNLGTLRCVIP